MFRILCDPSSGSTELCLTEITCSDSQIFCRVLFFHNQKLLQMRQTVFLASEKLKSRYSDTSANEDNPFRNHIR